MPTRQEIARIVDHTLLAPVATRHEIIRLCDEAVRYGFGAVCVNGIWVQRAASAVEGSGVRVCAVVGFPLGASKTEVKRLEAEMAMADGAVEIDMVLDIGALKDREDWRVRDDVAAIAGTVHERNGILKVILETGVLTEDEKVLAAELAVEGGADFVKTSTGFSPGGATIADVRLLRDTVGPVVGIKASGGIRTLKDALELIDAGATRLGTSRGVAIVGED